MRAVAIFLALPDPYLDWGVGVVWSGCAGEAGDQPVDRVLVTLDDGESGVGG